MDRWMVKEEVREMWGWTSFETLRQDLKYGLRMLLRNPAFAAVAVLSLALGIGANTTIFSIVNAVALRALPVHEPDRLMALHGTLRGGSIGGDHSYLDYRDFRGERTIFSGVAA